jgi:pilus assembly protein CpaF
MKEALVRIENMYLESRPFANIDFIRSQIVSAVDILVQLVRFPNGDRKVVAISELEKRIESNGVIAMNDIFTFERDGADSKNLTGTFHVTSLPSRTIEQMNMYGVDIDKRVFDPSFEITKDFLLSELKKDLPSKMCNWKDDFLDIYELKDNEFLSKWPHIGSTQ